MALRVLTILLLVIGCRARDLVLNGEAMGTRWMLTARVAEVTDPRHLRATVAGRLEEIERSMSTWRRDSEISRFNASRSTNWFSVTPDFTRVLGRGLEIAHATDGAFDPTVLPLVRLWGFTSGERSPTHPANDEILAVMNRVGAARLRVEADSHRVRKTEPATEVDLSAIAKGYAVDAVAELLEARSCTNWLVDVGGEVRGRGLSSRGRPWRIGIEEPLIGERRIHEIVELTEGAVATSGDYRNFIERRGRRYAHIIDAKSGLPIPQRGLAVSVRAGDCLTADAWATALCVLGPERGVELAERHGIAVLFIIMTSEGVESRPTRKWLEWR